jgi:hypothetical protein
MYYENGRREITREVRGEAHHSLDASSGESNYHYVTTRHAGGLPRNEYLSEDCAVGLV